MTILIKQARVTDPQSPHNGQIIDILTVNGYITRIATEINEQADDIVSIDGLHVSPGWVDIFAHFADPGFEHKETLASGAAAAAAGGFTDVMLTPNTKPAIDNKSTVEYLLQKAGTLPVQLHPIGAITKNTEGKTLAEMYDMAKSGAVAFSDGHTAVQSAGLLVKALQYVKSINATLIQVPEDNSIAPHGLMNEGVISTRLGLPGKPSIAEELMVARDIRLAEYTGSRIHFTGVSTRRCLELIRKGKENGVQITCSVTPYHLILCDEDLENYDTNLKVNPPLRTRDDRQALQDAISEGLIDCISSHHLPHETDSKVIEFEYAKYGMNGIQTVYSVLNTFLPEIPQEKWIRLLSVNPRTIFGLEPLVVREGEKAVLTLFLPQHSWTFSHTDNLSRSRNTAFLDQEFTGKVQGIMNGTKYVRG